MEHSQVNLANFLPSKACMSPDRSVHLPIIYSKFRYLSGNAFRGGLPKQLAQLSYLSYLYVLIFHMLTSQLQLRINLILDI